MTISGCLSTKSKAHSEWQLPIFGVHSIMMEKSSLAGEGGGGEGARPPHFTLLPSHTKLQGTLQLGEQVH